MLHLIHPAFVHLSVAFLVVGGITEAFGLWTGRDPVARFGEKLVLIGVVSLIPTLAFGYLAANTLNISGAGMAELDSHERNAWYVLGMWTLILFWKGWHRGTVPAGQARLYAVVLLLGVLLVAYNSLVGGEMVYVHGVGVGP